MSANALLMTYIGGVGVFAGPVIGAVLIVLLQSWVSLLSNSWLVYAGVLFIMMVTFAPGGIAGLVMMHQPIWRAGRLGRLAGPYAPLARPLALVVVGFVLAIELCSFLTIGAAQGKSLTLVRGHRRTRGASRPWIAAALLLAAGGLWLRVEMRRFGAAWGAVTEEIKAMGRAGMSATGAAPVLRLTDVHKSFGPTAVIMGVSLDVARGSRHAIIGPNGAGKTTLFNLISGRFPVSSGHDRARRPAHRRPGAARDQPARPLAQLPGHLDLRAHDRVREHPLRAPVVARLPVLVLAPAGRRARPERGGRAPPRRRQPGVAPGRARRACSPTPSSARSRSASRSRAGPTPSCSTSPPRG